MNKQGTIKAPYVIWFGHAPSVKYFTIFRCKCHIKREYDTIKFDAISDEGIAYEGTFTPITRI
jgi:hypothetical protein